MPRLLNVASFVAVLAFLALGLPLASRAQDGLITTIPMPQGATPAVVVVNEFANRAYVGNGTLNTVSVVDLADDSILTTISIGVDGVTPFPSDIAVDPLGDRIYVAMSAQLCLGSCPVPLPDSAVIVIDASTHAVIANISIGRFPRRLAVSSSNDRLYATTLEGVDVIDMTTDEVVETITAGLDPFDAAGIAVDSSTGRLFIGQSDSVAILDLQTHAVIDTIPFPCPSAPFGCGIGVLWVVVSEASHAAYAVNQKERSVLVIDTSSNLVLGSIEIPNAGSINDIALNAGTNRAYVTDSISIFEIDLDDGSITRTIPTTPARRPQNLAVDVFTNRAYVRMELPGSPSVPVLAVIDLDPIPLLPSACTTDNVAIATTWADGLIEVDLSTGQRRHAGANLFADSLAVSADGTTAHVLGRLGFGERLKTVDLRTGAAVIGGLFASSAADAALSATGTTLYVTQPATGEILAHDLETQVDIVKASGLDSLRGIEVSADETIAWVLEFGPGQLTEVDLASGVAVALATGLSQPRGLVVNGAEDTAYVVEDNSLAKIDLASGSVVQRISGLRNPSGVALNAAEDTVVVSSLTSSLGSGGLFSINLATEAITPLRTEDYSDVALSCDPPLQTLKLPVRWCGVRGAPSIDDPGQLNAATADAVMLERLQRVNDEIYLSGAQMSLISGATPSVGSFPLLDDPDPSPGALGDVLDLRIDSIEGRNQWLALMNLCRSTWESLDPTAGGSVAVQISRFVDRSGQETPLLGLGSIALGAEVMVVDNALLLPCSEQASPCLRVFTEDPFDKLLGHEVGHSLSLRHGNGLDDNADGSLDDPAEDELAGPETMLLPFLTSTPPVITRGQRDRMRAFALATVQDLLVDPMTHPLARSRSDALAEVPPSQAFVDIDSFGIWVDASGLKTTLIQTVAGLLPADISAVSYVFLVDIDNDPTTGGDAAAITAALGVSTNFDGAELLGEVVVEMVGDAPNTTPVVYTFEPFSGSFVQIDDLGIRAEVLTATVALITDPAPPPGEPSDLGIGQRIRLELSSRTRGPMGLDVRLEAIARVPGGAIDTATGQLSFRSPERAACTPDPASVSVDGLVTLLAVGLPAASAVEAFLGLASVASGATDAEGNATIQFAVPSDTAVGRRPIQVGVVGTGITAECDLVIEGPPDVGDPGDPGACEDSDADGRCDADLDLDEDGDGVADVNDQCLGTTLGDPVDVSGCSIAQHCPCVNPVGGVAWKNHGAYVSCTAHASDDFVSAGRITDEQRDEIVSAAVQSTCGKKTKAAKKTKVAKKKKRR